MFYGEAAEAHLDGGPTSILGISLREQGWRHTYVADCLSRVIVPYGPIISVNAVSLNGTALDADDYETVTDLGVMELRLVQPEAGKLVVDVTAGYGPEPTDVPADIRAGAYLLAADLWEHRTIHITGAAELVQRIPMFDGLILKHSKVGLYSTGWD